MEGEGNRKVKRNRKVVLFLCKIDKNELKIEKKIQIVVYLRYFSYLCARICKITKLTIINFF